VVLPITARVCLSSPCTLQLLTILDMAEWWTMTEKLLGIVHNDYNVIRRSSLMTYGIEAGVWEGSSTIGMYIYI